MTARTEFVTDAQGRRVAVLLNVKSYARLKEAEEDLADIRAYDRAKPRVMAEVKRGQAIPLVKHLKSKTAEAR